MLCLHFPAVHRRDRAPVQQPAIACVSRKHGCLAKARKTPHGLVAVTVEHVRNCCPRYPGCLAFTAMRWRRSPVQAGGRVEATISLRRRIQDAF